MCEDLCSLNPDEDRLTFSVEWRMNGKAEILGEPWFGRSVIRSQITSRLNCSWYCSMANSPTLPP